MFSTKHTQHNSHDTMVIQHVVTWTLYRGNSVIGVHNRNNMRMLLPTFPRNHRM
jgi:hypothetical protein